MKTNKQRIVFSLVFMLFALLTLAVADQDKILDELKSIAVIEQKVMVPMRDGVRLATDIYRPKTDQPVPVILSKTPYNFNSWGDGKLNTGNLSRAYDVVKRGYAYAVQNERGRYFSEGEWEILGAPRTDGYDAIQWLAGQRLVERQGGVDRLLLFGRVADGCRRPGPARPCGRRSPGLRRRYRTPGRIVTNRATSIAAAPSRC